MWFTCEMKYYSAIKSHEMLIHVSLCINLKNITLSESIQSQKTTYYFIQFIRNVQNRQTYKDGR